MSVDSKIKTKIEKNVQYQVLNTNILLYQNLKKGFTKIYDYFEIQH